MAPSGRLVGRKNPDSLHTAGRPSEGAPPSAYRVSDVTRLNSRAIPAIRPVTPRDPRDLASLNAPPPTRAVLRCALQYGAGRTDTPQDLEGPAFLPGLALDVSTPIPTSRDDPRPGSAAVFVGRLRVRGT
jgi:hypothetical protein